MSSGLRLPTLEEEDQNNQDDTPSTPSPSSHRRVNSLPPIQLPEPSTPQHRRSSTGVPYNNPGLLSPGANNTRRFGLGGGRLLESRRAAMSPVAPLGRRSITAPGGMMLNRSSSFGRRASATSANSTGTASGGREYKRQGSRSSMTEKIVRRSTALSRFTRGSSSMEDDMNTARQESTKAIYRGYKVGDSVLVNDLSTEWANQVNKHGYPPGAGNTAEELRGPFMFVLGKIKRVHFEEYSVYYTVTREDTGEDVRGEADFMEPLHTEAAEEAAKKAARDFIEGRDREEERKNEVGDGDGGNGEASGRSKVLRVVENICVCFLLPILWMYDIFVYVIGARLFRWGEIVFVAVRRQAHLFLYGMSPYTCSSRITTINVVVLCSTWYMFIDQARLAFFPTNADWTLAVINCVIWTILVLELFFEVFIRPDGYHNLVQSDKAFAPTTVRFLSSLHLAVELISLVFFVPEFLCLFTDEPCDGKPRFSFLNASLLAITGPDRKHALAGRAFFAVVRLRVFVLVRHWKNMWISRTFLNGQSKLVDKINVEQTKLLDAENDDGRDSADEEDNGEPTPSKALLEEQKIRDAALIGASNIGTALMVTNSYRALSILCAVLVFFPMIDLIFLTGVVNPVASEMVKQLQATNSLVNTTTDSSGCEFLARSIDSWMDSLAPRNLDIISSGKENFLVSVAIEPSRCLAELEALIEEPYRVSTQDCKNFEMSFIDHTSSAECLVLSFGAGGTLDQVAQEIGIRRGAIQSEMAQAIVQPFDKGNGTIVNTPYMVMGNFNQTYQIETSAVLSLVLQFCLLATLLGGLLVLRYDAESLVLGPLRSMLKIVARYAKNPLASERSGNGDGSGEGSDSGSEPSEWDEKDVESELDQFGNYETEQLIRAVSIITELLRLCWGVAGADIISTNLASREGALAEVFNPTVPGKSVYALFAFAAIKGYDHALKCLGGDVVILINDVAAVLHNEVFRWGFGDSGQCNKNLGAAFLMVFRIGLVKEVVEKLDEATNVVFDTTTTKKALKKRKAGNTRHGRRETSSNVVHVLRSDIARRGITKLRHRRQTQDSAITDAMQLSLQSLPGISTFTDRAVIGMLKSFAGIHRDNKLRAWSRDFRLSAGVGAFSVDMIFGMDAGWAVEGAVGSEYKIDATYLSPHVNMASRMMSACKQYGVTILLSEAVQELMSDVARSKLRHIDRVTVKGSTRIQKIFTYDARHKGADFFLFSRSDEQADMEAERYVPSIWLSDQDLTAMRHHLTDDFEQEFNAGMKAYMDGDWPTAIQRLETANEIMVDAAMEEGYLHDELDSTPDRKEFYRTETADGPSAYLVHFMKSQGGVAPDDWDGWHPLLSK